MDAQNGLVILNEDGHLILYAFSIEKMEDQGRICLMPQKPHLFLQTHRTSLITAERWVKGPCSLTSESHSLSLRVALSRTPGSVSSSEGCFQ